MSTRACRAAAAVAIAFVLIIDGFLAGAPAAGATHLANSCAGQPLPRGASIIDPGHFVGAPRALPVGIAQCGYQVNNLVYALWTEQRRSTVLAIAREFLAEGWRGTMDNSMPTSRPLDLDALAVDTADEWRLRFDNTGAFVQLYWTDLVPAGVANMITTTFLAPVSTQPPTAGTPSSLSSVHTVNHAVTSPSQGVALILSAALLTLLIGVPGFLLTSVLNRRWSGLGTRLRSRAKTLGERAARVGAAHPERRRWILTGGTILVAAIVSGFIDPRFGFNGMSARVVATQLLAFAAFDVGGWALIRRVRLRIGIDARPVLEAHPASLLVVALAVILSRLLSFDPGIVFGLVAGVTFTATLAKTSDRIVMLAGAGYALAAGVSAWVLYSLAVAILPAVGNVPALALIELLGGLTLIGASTLPLSLLPLGELDGSKLFGWNRLAWALVYAVAIGLFLLVAVDIPSAAVGIPADFARWLSIFAVFAVVSVAVWVGDGVLRRRASAAADAPHDGRAVG